ncbi:MAG: hypothetical protein HUK20_05900 [Fibrobacter sp.]|nr:hypothetical protein [Fibrobacter sp.]
MKLVFNLFMNPIPLIVIVALTLLSACSNPEAEAKIKKLSQENEMLSKKADSLQNELNGLKVRSDSIKQVLKSLDLDN